MADSKFHFLARIAIGAAFGLLIGGASFWAAGDTLGFWIGCFFGVALALPALAVADARLRSSAMMSSGLLLGMIALLIILPDNRLYPFAARLPLCILMIVWCLMLFGLTRLLSAIGIPVSASASFVTILGIVWLLMPVWLPAHCTAAAVAHLAMFHPPLIANGLLESTAPWTEMPIAYANLTQLNQDIPLALPGSAIPCIAVDAAIGVVAMLGANYLRARAANSASVVGPTRPPVGENASHA
jgi:hypothetical protein